MRMSLLDRALYLLDSARSPQDFTLIFDLRDAPEVERFYAGAQSAMSRFPVSACCVAGGAWVWRGSECFKLTVAEDSEAIERFIGEPFDLRSELPVKQLLLLGRLATRFHHAAADGFSALLWLGHQLSVAYGFEREETERGRFDAPMLRGSSQWVRRSQFAFPGASDPLHTSKSTHSGSRRWSTISFPSLRRTRTFTYHDLLATCTLEVLRMWNDCRGGPPWPPSVESKLSAIPKCDPPKRYDC